MGHSEAIELLEAFEGVIAYAEAEQMALWGCKDSDDAEAEAKRCDVAIERAQEAIRIARKMADQR